MPEAITPALESGGGAIPTATQGSKVGEKEKRASGDFVLTNYAVLEGGNWYAVVSCRCRGKVCPDEMLRDRPCATPEEALSVGRQHVESMRR